MRRSFRACALLSALLTIALGASIALAAPEKPPPNLITVVRTDGPPVRGTLVSSDPDNVVVQPVAKPGQKDKDAQTPEQVTIPWKDIKTVSNGLTRAKALEAWKAQHRDQLCEACRGDRTVLCPTCKGTLHDPAALKDCKTCGGELLVECKAPKCDHGTIPCPRTCLKLTEGQWYKKPDGHRWRKFPSRNGYYEWSEGHVGELIVTDPKTGEVRSEGRCPTCGGKTTIDCPTCHGLAKVPCATCAARKDAPPCPDKCDHGRVPCTQCSGTGLKKA
jgi:hypothetical protein